MRRERLLVTPEEWLKRGDAERKAGKFVGYVTVCPVHLRPAYNAAAGVDSCGCGQLEDPETKRRETTYGGLTMHGLESLAPRFGGPIRNSIKPD